MAVGSVLAFWAVALLLIAVPGADWAFTIGAGLRGPVLPAVGGLVAGYAAVTVVVAAGVGALVAGSPAMLGGLTLAGGLYLMWHGVATLARPAEPSVRDEPGTGWTTFLRGVGVSGLNPKGLLIFLALLPQFTDPGDGWPVAAQIGVLGLAFMATCGVFYFCLGTLTRTVLDARPGAARLTGRLSGAAMTALGAWLLVDHVLH
ncbi:LysE family transporter [Actinomadura madurae]|uniref:LysE family translocator n=1 Tax=Actinomadura madurae TaxID=1993 RepID=UPI0020263C67|nr:LysE family transporter [Actinomadura madurae]MCP9969182.1 LysE family transporter [Actinomadura madurae]URM97945.1 LysE family transporter [Actinomadura madurae]URN08637.1 LysE family transporter [Actinomadura madurae]